MHRANWSSAVKSCYLFSGAERQSIEALADASRVLKSSAGETLFQTGDAADGLRIVLSGLVRIWIADGEGHELTLALMEPGDPFGEIALLDGLPRTANATAIERSDCLMLPCKAMEEVLARDPSLARHLIQLLCEFPQ
ncbi:Crp/Fnr family transcriptional regulator [Roseovarius sp. S4756]|uniref:Crp/Fnr family transcriptional regulator n=1 Tax=Roseovarius maritimus TaxID=3342637 RepID=UPI003729505A